MSDLIAITVNGETRQIPRGMTVGALLSYLGLEPRRVAVERNFEIVPRDRFPTTPISVDDKIEVVHFVGGG